MSAIHLRVGCSTNFSICTEDFIALIVYQSGKKGKAMQLTSNNSSYKEISMKVQDFFVTSTVNFLCDFIILIYILF